MRVALVALSLLVAVPAYAGEPADQARLMLYGDVGAPHDRYQNRNNTRYGTPTSQIVNGNIQVRPTPESWHKSQHGKVNIWGWTGGWFQRPGNK